MYYLVFILEKKINKNLIQIPKYKSINLHPSLLLPRYDAFQVHGRYLIMKKRQELHFIL